METQEERKERKAAYIAYALSKSKGMVDEETITLEASKHWEEVNRE